MWTDANETTCEVIRIMGRIDWTARLAGEVLALVSVYRVGRVLRVDVDGARRATARTINDARWLAASVIRDARKAGLPA